MNINKKKKNFYLQVYSYLKLYAILSKRAVLDASTKKDRFKNCDMKGKKACNNNDNYLHFNVQKVIKKMQHIAIA